jgi:hypothetical protein
MVTDRRLAKTGFSKSRNSLFIQVWTGEHTEKNNLTFESSRAKRRIFSSKMWKTTYWGMKEKYNSLPLEILSQQPRWWEGGRTISSAGPTSSSQTAALQSLTKVTHGPERECSWFRVLYWPGLFSDSHWLEEWIRCQKYHKWAHSFVRTLRQGHLFTDICLLSPQNVSL